MGSPRARGAEKLGPQLAQGDREGARHALLQVYLDDIEPIEAPLRARDPALTRDLEASFKDLRSDIERGAPTSNLEPKLEGLLGLLSKAAVSLDGADGAPSFLTTMFSSTGIALREGVEAALLIAALLAVVARAGGNEREMGPLWLDHGRRRWGADVVRVAAIGRHVGPRARDARGGERIARGLGALLRELLALRQARSCPLGELFT